MNEQILAVSAVIESSTGSAILVRPGEAAKLAEAGMQLIPQDILITPKNAEVIVQINGQQVLIDKNCVSCLTPQALNNGQNIAIAPISGDVTVDPSAVANELAILEGDEIANIQAAILDGIDPTLELEAAAAGGQAATSANGGFVTIDYTYVESLASTFFQTQGQQAEQIEEDEDTPIVRPGEGGEQGTSSITEGTLNTASALQSSTIVTTVNAGNRPLDPSSFTFETVSLEALLAELNSEVTSSGEPVVFSFDEASNSIIGVQGDVTIITFSLVSNSVGANVELSLTTTLEQPIDHNTPLGNAGLVRFTDNNLSIDFAIQGQDTNSNGLLSPVVLTPTIIDGQAQTAENVDIVYTETKELNPENPVNFEGTAINIGSDYLQDIRFDDEITALFDSVLTNNQSLEAVLSDDGRTLSVFVVGEPENRVLDATISLDGSYTITQYQVLEQLNDLDDILSLPLPITSVDFDGDTVTNTINYQIVDGSDAVALNPDSQVIFTELTTLDGSVNNAISESGSAGFVAGTDSIESVVWDISQETILFLDNMTTNDGKTSWTLSPDGKTILVQREVDGADVLELKIEDLEGNYTVRQFLSIDQDISQNDGDDISNSGSQLDLTLLATDADGDKTFAKANITILDGQSITIGNDSSSISLTEIIGLDGSETNAISSSDSLEFSQGTDAIERVEWAISDAASQMFEALTSKGNDTSWELIDEDRTIRVFVTENGVELDVLVISLSDDNSGSYQVTQFLPIDQNLQSNINQFVLTAMATDTDGSQVSSDVTVALNDGVDTQLTNSRVTLTEQLDSAGNFDSANGTTSGTTNIIQGVDGSEISIDLITDVSNWTSQGKALQEITSADGNTITLVTQDGQTPVLSLVFNPVTGGYDVTQSLPIDQVSGSGSKLTFKVTADSTDDNDKTANIVVNIKDGVDTQLTNSRVTLTEQLDSAGNFDSANGTTSGTTNIIQGVDGSEISIDLITDVSNWTSQGKALQEITSADGNTITLVTQDGQTPVLSLVFNPVTGGYDVTQSLPIDQVSGSGSKLTFKVTADSTDDNDKTANIVVNIKDGVDTQLTNSRVTLTEQLDSAGNFDSANGTTSGTTNIIQGVDGSEISIDLITDVSNWTSQGKALQEITSADGNTITLVAQDGQTPVLSLVFNPVTGGYDVTQSLPIDQVSGSGSKLTFKVTADSTDDNDKTANIVVNIKDGVDTQLTNSSVTLTEQLDSAGNFDSANGTIAGTTNIVQGVDGSEISIDLITDVSNWTSQGKALQEITSADGNTITLVTQDGQTPVLSLVFNPVTGGYDVTQSLPIDQVSGSGSKLTFKVTADSTDDNDKTANIVVNIKDGVDTQLTNSRVTLTEQLDSAGNFDSANGTTAGTTNIVQGVDGSEISIDLITDVSNWTSQGKALQEITSADGNTITLVTQDGQTPVLSLVFNPVTGGYDVTQSLPIDQVSGSGSKLTFKVTADSTDDNDKTANIVVNIKDGVDTQLTNSSVTLTEQLDSAGNFDSANGTTSGTTNIIQGVDGSEISIDLITDVSNWTSQGKALQEITSADGNTITLVTQDGQTPVLSLVFNPVTGGYDVTQSLPIDQVSGSGSKLTFKVTADSTDDNDKTANIVVNIKDGVDTQLTNSSVTLTEQLDSAGNFDSANGTTAGTTNIVQGVDGSEISIDLITDVSNWTSQGKALQEITSADGNTITLVTQDGQTPVLNLVFNPVTGGYDVTQSLPIDQVSGSGSKLTFKVTADSTDDNDKTANIVVNIKDGVDTQLTNSRVTLTEQLDSAGNFDSTNGTTSGTTNIIQGVDGSEISIVLSTDVSGWTSNGDALTLLPTTDNGNTFTFVTANNTSNPVLVLKFNNETGGYEVTQYQAIDQEDGKGSNLKFTVTADSTDDADKSATINIKIKDGENPEVIVNQDASLTESTNMSQSTPAKVTIDELVTFDKGVDAIDMVAIELTTDISSLTSSGELLTSSTVGSTFTLYLDGTTTKVLEATLDEITGDLKVDQYLPLDNPANNKIALNFKVTATDTDGDSDSARFGLTLLDGQDPEINSISKLTVSEIGSNSRSDSTTIILEASSDNIKSFDIDIDNVSFVAENGDLITGLTSGGREITFQQIADGFVGVIDLNDDANNPDYQNVIELTVISDYTDPNFGKVTFSIVAPIDHPGDNTDKITLTVPVSATDFDSDTSEQIGLLIDIVDQVPTLRDRTLTVDEGDSIDNIQMFIDKGMDGASITDITSSDAATLKLDGQESISVSGTTQSIIVSMKESDGQWQEIGTLTVKSNGKVSFSANSSVENLVGDVVAKLIVTATDSDGDQDQSDLTLVIKDQVSSLLETNIVGKEDSGQLIVPNDNYGSSDNPPIGVLLTVNVGDIDANESVSSITIVDPEGGAFYYYDGSNYIKIDGNEISGTQLTTSSNNVDQLSITNIFFIPDRHFSTDASGIQADVTVTISRQLINADGTTSTIYESVSSEINVVVQGIADTPEWLDSFEENPIGVEDSSSVKLDFGAFTQDQVTGNTPETINYELEFTTIPNLHVLETVDGTEISPDPDGIYRFTSDEIDNVYINSADNFSGQIELTVKAISNEPESNAVIPTAESTNTIIVDIKPVADDATLEVERVNVIEDNAFQLKDHITVVELDDLTDSSEQAYIELIDLPEGSYFSYKDTDSTQITLIVDDNGKGVKVDSDGNVIDPTAAPIDLIFSYDVIQDEYTTITPPLDSNVDFDFNVKLTIVDEANLQSDPDATDTNNTIAEKTIHVDIKGVADLPAIGTESTNQWIIDQATGEIRTSTPIDEYTGQSIGDADGEYQGAKLDFSVVSGELGDHEGLLGRSETISVVISDDGSNGDYKIIDINTGNEISLTYIGTENGKPKYEANIDNADVMIVPAENNTDDIHLTAKIIVTENDGDQTVVEKNIVIEVTPVISGFENPLTGDNSFINQVSVSEDSDINVRWYPRSDQQQLADNDELDVEDNEYVTKLELESITDRSDIDMTILVSGDYLVTYLDGSPVQTVSIGNQSYYSFTADSSIIIEAKDGGALTAANLKITANLPEDSTEDFTLETKVTIAETDVDTLDVNGEPIVSEATYNGAVNVSVAPVVEANTELDLNTSLTPSDVNGESVYTITDGSISFSRNSEDTSADVGVGVKQDLDADSDEKVDQIVVEFDFGLDKDALNDPNHPDHAAVLADFEYLIDQLYVTGAINNGDGTWTITDEDLFSIHAPDGLLDSNGDPVVVDVIIHTEVVDYVTSYETENSSPVQKDTTITLQFTKPATGFETKAASGSIEPSTVVTGAEDTQIELKDFLSGKVVFTDLGLLSDGNSGINDEIALVFDFSSAPAGTGISFGTSGGEDNFDNGLYTAVINVGDIDLTTGLLSDEALTGLMLNLPEDYAGEFTLPVAIVVTDLDSGDETQSTLNIPVRISPVVDGLDETNFVDGDESGEYAIVQTVTDADFTNAQESKPTVIADNTAYEDSAIKLNLNHLNWEDNDTDQSRGIESFQSITLTPPLGSGSLSVDNSAYSDNVTIDANTGAITIIASNGITIETVLENIIFTPKTDFSGSVELTLTGTIVDSTSFVSANDGAFTPLPDDTAVDNSYSATISFDVVSVVDDVAVKANNIKGTEDNVIRLDNLKFTLGDVDQSEEFVSFKITDVPDDFQIKSLGNNFSVKNNGDGEWSIQIRADLGIEATLDNVVIVPAEDFSGTVNLGYSVYVQEKDTEVPRETSGTFEVNIAAVGDDIDTRIDSSPSGIEGGQVIIQIDASVIDNENSIDPGSNYNENSPETVYIKIDNVPELVQVTLPGISTDDYTAIAEVVNGVYTGSWIITTTLQEVTSIALDLANTDYNNDYWSSDSAEITVNVYADDNGSRGQVSTGVVSLDITPINDAPTLTLPSDVVGDEDTAINITSIVIADPDQFDDSDPDVDGHQDGTYTVTLSNSDGVLSISDEAKSAFPNVVITTVSGELTLSGNIADINDLLSGNYTGATAGSEGIIFTPNSNFNGNTNIAVSVDDNGNNGTGDADHTFDSQFEVSVTPINDTPTLTLPTNVEVDEDTTVNITSLVIGDVDQLDDTYDQNGEYTVILTNTDGVLSISDQAQSAFPNIVVSTLSGELTLSGNITDINDLLAGNYTGATSGSEGVIFTPNSDFNGDTSITVSVDDNGNNGTGTAASKFESQFNVTVNAVNDAPENTLFDSLSVTEGSITKLVGLSVDDSDYASRPDTTPITVTLSTLHGELTAQIPNSLLNTTVDSSNPNQIIIKGPISEVNQLLSAKEGNEGIFYSVSSSNTETTDTFTMVTNDGGNYDSVGTTILEDTDTAGITIAPVVSGVPQLELALQTQQIRTNVSSTLAGVGIPLIGLNASLVSASADTQDTQESVIIRISDLPDTATVTGATLSDGSWIIDAANLDSAEIHGLTTSAVLSIVAIAEEPNATSVESSVTTVNIVVDGDSIIGDENTNESDPLLIVASNDDTTLIGTSSADILVGGTGEDTFTGGAGADEFVWTETNLNNNVDTILDFSTADNDTINLLDLLDTGETLEAFLQDHVTATIVDHDTVGDGKDVNLEIQVDGLNSPQNILLEGMGELYSSATDVLSAMLQDHVFKD
ncbi:retention module-containing protein [Vibrio algarum]|uniref:Retention module-containing protein n=1 Tax=Vibrio algarum TaxID=3020714 RepID=A0ABT4YQM8_9VIBR|nr:retention module-containing protein [Vibrio sp. KJ40-1]MDB1123866.1 retention module-containing protein [Vibrio sp. KJ40-1]